MGGITLLWPPLTNESATAKQVVGAEYEDPKTGKRYRYVQAGAAISAQAALKYNDGVATNQAATSVIMATNASEYICGIANSAITSGDYFWMQVAGPAAVLSADVTNGQTCTTTTTDGTVDNAAATDVGSYDAVALEDDGATTAGQTTVFLR